MSSTGPRFYKRPPPTSPDAYRIWNDCCLGEIAEVMDIYWALDTWARLNCAIDMRLDRPYVFWLSPSGVRHECYADTFAHWILCACEELQPPPPPQPLTPKCEIQPTFPLEPIPEEQTNEIIFHDVQKIGDDADKVIEEALKENLAEEEEAIFTLEEIVQMNLDKFLNEAESTE